MTTRERVAAMLELGRSLADIARELGVSKSTVSWHARRLGRPARREFAARYNWAEIQHFYDAGHSRAECCLRFGVSRSAFAAAVSDGRLIPRPRRKPLCDLLVSGGRTSRHELKRRVVDEHVKPNRCEECGIDAWLGEPLSLHLHHINGDRRDHRLENLQLLCPNCHSQTGNFGARGLARERA